MRFYVQIRNFKIWFPLKKKSQNIPKIFLLNCTREQHLESIIKERAHSFNGRKGRRGGGGGWAVVALATPCGARTGQSARASRQGQRATLKPFPVWRFVREGGGIMVHSAVGSCCSWPGWWHCLPCQCTHCLSHSHLTPVACLAGVMPWSCLHPGLCRVLQCLSRWWYWIQR